MLELRTIVTESSVINKVYKEGEVDQGVIGEEGFDSLFFLLTTVCGTQSVLVASKEDTLIRINTKGLSYQRFSPKDATQSCFFWALSHYDLIVGIGEAGTGKTSCALAYGINEVFRNEKSLVLCKPTVYVGKKSNAMGTISGDHREKMEGYIDSYLASLRKILGENFEHHLYQLEEEGKILFQPLELLRGLHFEDCVLIIDEAQNTSVHELMTALSRVGANSTVIILGDPHQIDTEDSWDQTGLNALVSSDSFFESGFATGIKLTGQYRGPMAILASKILKEIYLDKSKSS